MKLRRLVLYGLIVIVLLIVSAVTSVFLWGPGIAWNYGAQYAKDLGFEIEKKDISISWKSGLRFAVQITDFSLKASKPVEARIEISKLFLDINYLRDLKRVEVRDFLVENVRGTLAVFKSSEKSSTEKEAPAQPFVFPNLTSIEIDLPGLPVDLIIQQAKITTGKLDFTYLQRGKEPELRGSMENLSFVTQGSWEASKFLNQSSISLAKGSAIYRTSKYNFVVQSLSLDAKVSGEGAKAGPKLRTRISGNAVLDWQTFNLDVSNSPIALQGERGKVHGRLEAQGPSFQLAVNRVKGLPSIKSPVDIDISVQPKIIDPQRMKILFKIASGKLAQGSGEFTTARRLDRAMEDVQVRGNIVFESDLISIFEPRWPKALTGPTRMEFNLAKKGDLISKAQFNLKSNWLESRIFALGDPNKKIADASASFELRLPGNGVNLMGHQIGGLISVPMKILARGKERIYFESTPEFKNFSYASPEKSGLKLSGIDGKVFLSQSWQNSNQGWAMHPILAWNPFNRVDLDSSEILDNNQKSLVIQKFSFQNRVLGPMRLTASFKQNLLFVPSWNLQCPQGRIQGILLTDFQPARPRVGMGLRAIEIDLARVLPDSVFQGRRIHPDPMSFTLNMDWDLANAAALGNFDWLKMTPGQVHSVLDILDPLAEKASFNTARSLLNTAHPTRVIMDLRGSVADLKISTNVLEVPPVNDIAISPYLVKARESLFQSDFYKQLNTSPRSIR